MLNNLLGIVDKILNRFLQGRSESIKNKISRLEFERDKILNQDSSDRNIDKLNRVLERLHKQEEKLKHRAT